MVLEEHNFFTIIIPTYNRCELLKSSLEHLMPIVAKYGDKVRVYVSDNASPDATEHVVRDIMSKYPSILRYFRQERNIEGIPNFIHAVKNVNADYIALVGDDDFLSEGYIQTTLELLKQHPDLGLINFNVIGCRNSMNEGWLRDKLLKSAGPFIYEKGGDFLKEHLSVPSLMSSNVVRREYMLEGLRDISLEEYPGYGWFAAMCFGCVEHKIAYVGFPMVMARVDSNESWHDKAPLYLTYGMGHLFKDLDVYAPGVNECWKKSFSADYGTNKIILYQIFKHRKFYKEHRGNVLPYIYNNRIRRLASIYISWPHFIAVVIYGVNHFYGKIIRRLTKGITA